MSKSKSKTDALLTQLFDARIITMESVDRDEWLYLADIVTAVQMHDPDWIVTVDQLRNAFNAIRHGTWADALQPRYPSYVRGLRLGPMYHGLQERTWQKRQEWVGGLLATR